MNHGTVLITGASGGIGLKLAKIFAEKKQNLVLVARNEIKLNEVATELRKSGINVLVLAKDLSKTGAAKEIFEKILSQQINIEILINNAGFGDYGYFHETDWDKELQMINLNIIALTELTKLFLPKMVAQKQGRILNVASTAGFMPGPMMAIYFATKAFVVSFSKSLSSELKGSGVTVTALCPGPTETGFESAANAGNSNLFHTIPVASSASVAQYAYKSMMKGKNIAIPGILNRIMIGLIGYTPRSITAFVVRKIMKKGTA